MTRAIILVGLGGGLGSIFRYLTSLLVARYIQSAFPYATFTVNILGCLIIGLLFGLFERQQLTDSGLRLLFITGFCGGYTTFSAFAAENIHLLHSGKPLTAFIYITTSVVLGLLATFVGIAIIRLF